MKDLVKPLKSEPGSFIIENLMGEVYPSQVYKAEITLIKIEPEKILGKKTVNGKVYFLVKYKFYPRNFNRWISETDLIK